MTRVKQEIPFTVKMAKAASHDLGQYGSAQHTRTMHSAGSEPVTDPRCLRRERPRTRTEVTQLHDCKDRNLSRIRVGAVSRGRLVFTTKRDRHSIVRVTRAHPRTTLEGTGVRGARASRARSDDSRQPGINRLRCRRTNAHKRRERQLAGPHNSGVSHPYAPFQAQ